MDEGDDYVLGRSDAETRRLILQDQIYRPVTRRLFEAAGIGTGMSVLDLGSGAGDVALLLAELVGPKGRVTGIDMNPAILEVARARVAAAGWGTVEFRAGTIDAAALEAGFDAIVGRWVLMYLPDPVAVLRSLVPLLKPGGIVAFNEMDMGFAPRTVPPLAEHGAVGRWLIPPEGAPGPDMRLGTKLFRIFVDAGLPAPDMRLEVPLGGGPDWPGYAYVGETYRSLLPALRKMAPPDTPFPDAEGLAGRLRDEVVAAGGIQTLPALVGAWSRRR